MVKDELANRMEKPSLLLVMANGAILLLLGIALAFLFTETGIIGNRDPLTVQSAMPDYGGIAVTLPLIRRAAEELAPEKRQEVLANPNKFQNFVHEQVLRRAIIAAARNDKILWEDPGVGYRMRTVAEQVLIDEYLKGRLDTGISEDFPYEKQMREFYEQNKNQFLLKERLHVWQIFFALPKNASDTERERAMATARALVEKLKSGQIGFGDAAAQYSEHEPSRSNGGYLGVFEVSQLFPQLRDALVRLDEGQISDPVRSDTGIHILKRGAKIPARTLTFGQAREKIRSDMRNMALNDLRKRMLDEIYRSHGKPVSETSAEQWRAALRSNYAQKPDDGTKSTILPR
uniref:peptidylprolyl isomerase n=1 Tax=Candidatus Kentrum sp. DK TaxID=2126562 RepID=A0A450RWP2_9GAMM|nr:MAG: Parvulin-like peptidyl-prolyl isomerase [Candidatus Kentron sp. DK]